MIWEISIAVSGTSWNANTFHSVQRIGDPTHGLWVVTSDIHCHSIVSTAGYKLEWELRPPIPKSIHGHSSMVLPVLQHITEVSLHFIEPGLGLVLDVPQKLLAFTGIGKLIIESLYSHPKEPQQ